jgi:hypothetical protein
MTRLDPSKLHVVFSERASSAGLIRPRRYTLTHSDTTGDLFLTIGHNFNQAQISGLYTRLLRDEVMAEWKTDASGPALHVYCHVSGGLTLGPAGWRDAIFRRELPLVLQAFRHGDRALYRAQPALDTAPIRVHFRARQRRYNRVERWGTPADYRLPTSQRRNLPEDR